MKTKKSFTLIEILITIVIIGVLGVILIPKIMTIQSKARNTTRIKAIQDLSQAIDMYAADNKWEYPIATVHKKQEQSNIQDVQDLITKYIREIPLDPQEKWLSANTSAECVTQGTHYAYYSDKKWTRYAITTIHEWSHGNTNNCGGVVDSYNQSSYYVVGRWIIGYHNIKQQAIYNKEEDDPTTRCIKHMTDEELIELNILAGKTASKESRCNTTEIILSNKNLQSIPTGIRKIVNLKNLNLNNNNLTAITIPHTMEHLTNINLATNNLRNITIPAGSANNLKRLYLNDNNLQSIVIPDTMEKIEHIWLANNQLQTITIPLWMLSIQSIDLSHNQIENITLPMGMRRIRYLWIQHNNIQQITLPPDIEKLQSLYLDNNNLTNIVLPDTMKHIEHIGIAENQLTTITIPDSFHKLQYLNLHKNNLSSIHISPTIKTLKSLFLWQNKLTTISPWVQKICTHYKKQTNAHTDLCTKEKTPQ